MINNEQMKDLCWRMTSYQHVNSLPVQFFIPIRLCIMLELFSTYPQAVIQKELQATYNLHGSSLSRTLIKLEKDGFIKRDRNSKHTTGLSIELTTTGYEFAEYAFEDGVA